MIYRGKKFIYCGAWKTRQGDRPYGDVFATFEKSPFGFGNWIVSADGEWLSLRGDKWFSRLPLRADGEQRSDLAKFLRTDGKKLWSTRETEE